MATYTRKYSDLDATFAPHPVTGDISLRRDEHAIKFAVKSLLLTNFYEKPFHPEIGSPLRKMLFENINDITTLTCKQIIADLLTNYEPRIVLELVDVYPSDDNNLIYISVKFRIKNTTIPVDVSIALERTR